MSRILVPEKAKHLSDPASPLEDFPIRYQWHDCYWKELFDLQIKLIQDDINRARAEDKLIIYLSCPISSRGGGYHGTNVDVAKHTERSLLQKWGERFWILNPAQYQLESKAGTGLIKRHAEALDINLDELNNLARPSGGDYMRMWTRVLVMDEPQDQDHSDDPTAKWPDPAFYNSGQKFDAFYFLGPTDVLDFFTKDGTFTLTAGLELYFSRRFETDPDFRDYYSLAGIRWARGWDSDKSLSASEKQTQQNLRQTWEERRRQFVRFYGLRASVNFSLGSHDEWNIFRLINEKRRNATRNPQALDGDVGVQLAGLFDGSQLDPASTETKLSCGYAV